MLKAEEDRIVSECISKSVEDEETSQQLNDNDQKYFFNKYIKLKKYLYNNEEKFVELEQTHLKAIRQVYSLLSPEQKMKLIRKQYFYLIYTE